MRAENDLGKEVAELAARLPSNEFYNFVAPTEGLPCAQGGLYTNEYGPLEMSHGIERRPDGAYKREGHRASIQRVHQIEGAIEVGPLVYRISGVAWTALHIENAKSGPDGSRFRWLNRPSNIFQGLLRISKEVAPPDQDGVYQNLLCYLDDLRYSYRLEDPSQLPEISRLATSNEGRKEQRVFGEWIKAMRTSLEWQRRNLGGSS